MRRTVEEGGWCVKCEQIEKLTEAVRAKGGTWLDQDWAGTHQYHRFRCAEGHEWSTEGRAVLAGKWCPQCARVTKEEVLALVKERGGEWLSEEYVNGATPLRLRCALGHEWTTTYRNLDKGHWCPHCARNAPVSLEDVRALAKSYGGTCLSDVYVSSSKPLLFECGVGHQFKMSLDTLVQGSWCRACLIRTHTIESLSELVARRGGLCLSTTYEGVHRKLQWQCKNGHVWMAPPHNVLKGHWCRECALEERLPRRAWTIEDIRALAKSRLGECLSPEYTNHSTHLRWRCSKGHAWRAAPGNVIAGTWCPTCARQIPSIGPRPIGRNRWRRPSAE
ncbi:MAG: hypothetical protein HYV07_19510 [Deltaproteobacteria bacterium]|nr:hypothetical protein [Deltaproteobacteria bacterium]